MASQPRAYLTSEEYLAIERKADERSEFHDGEMFAMAGASYAHNLLVANLSRALGNQLIGSQCRVLAGDMRVLIATTGHYTYPDVLVVCGKPALVDRNGDVLTNPSIIVEVLSESTKDYDRGTKFAQYRQIPSLKEYITISQTEKLAEQWLRQSDGGWLLRETTGKLVLPSLNIEIGFDQIYDGVEFTAA